ncbi:MAG: hypothetical protein ABIO70_29365 [Pseudomonadota bacterium]
MLADGTGSGGGQAWAGWQAERQRRIVLAADPARQPELMAAWPFAGREALLPALLGPLQIPDSPDIRRLAGWVFGPAPASGSAPSCALQQDLHVLAQAEPRRVEPEQRRAAALYLLARLGEELARREHGAWRAQRWPEDPRDAEARHLWGLALGGRDTFEAGALFQRLFSAEVTRAFQGVCMSVGLSSDFAREKAALAREQIDLAGLGMHQDIAARVVETSGEPIDALVHSLGPGGLQGAWTSIRQHLSWDRARRALVPDETDPPPEIFPEGADLVVFQRLLAHLAAGQAPPHRIGLPGWGVVAANRARMRGRLRALVAREPAGLARAILGLDALWARSAAAVGRHAWEWAWREARVGFGFHLDRMRAAPCTAGSDAGDASEPLGPEHEGAVRTFLLSILARDRWDTLERWLQGAAGRSLGGSFYRHLARIPVALAHPGANRYRRLWEHLSDGGLDAYLPSLEEVARRVVAVPEGRDTKATLRAALRPDWDPEAIALPQHHLTTLRRSFERFLTAGGPQAGPGGAP